MSRSDYRSLLGGVVLLSAAALLLELLTFRVGALAVGWSFGFLVSLFGPVVMALGGVVLGRSPAAAQGPEISRRATHLAALGGAGVVAGAIGITWASQQIAFGVEISGAMVVAVAGISFIVPFFHTGGALALLMRRGARRIGRLGYAGAMGGVLGCALLPLAGWAGYPLALIAVAFLHAGAAGLLLRSARPERVRGALVATLPLVVTALIAGDLGAPWMKVRVDHGRFSRFDRLVWTPQGTVVRERLEGTSARVGLDRNVPLGVAHRHSPKVKPRYQNTEMGFLIREEHSGPTLVIASGGGHQVDAALAYGASRVDAMEVHRGFLELLEDPDYARFTGNPWSADGVTTYLGDGRAGLDRLPGDYDNVVLLTFHQPDQAAPRFLSRHRRLITVEAMRTLMRRLSPDGRLVMLVPREAYPSAVGAIFKVLGVDVDLGVEHVVVCSRGDGAVVAASRRAFDDSEASRMRKRCVQSRTKVLLPLGEERPGSAGDAVRATNRDTLAALRAATVATDDVPFAEPPPPFAALPREAREALVEMAPDLSVPPGRRDGELTGDKMPTPRHEGLAVVAALGALVSLLLGALWRAPAPADDRDRPPWALRAAFPFLGAALALCTFSLGDRLLRVAGNGDFAWWLIVPMSLVGVGAGRLWVDTLQVERARRVTMLTLAVGLIWLLLLHVVGARLEGLVHQGEIVRWAMIGGLLFISGFLLGFPAAAVLRFVSEWDRASVAWGWSMHAAGWALGGTVAALAVPYVGVARIWPLGLAGFAIAATLVTVGGRVEPPPSRWYLRRLR